MKNIEKIPQHYDSRKIQSHLYVDQMDANEHENLGKNIDELIKESDSAIIIPICQSYYAKKRMLRT